MNCPIFNYIWPLCIPRRKHPVYEGTVRASRLSLAVLKGLWRLQGLWPLK